MDIDFKIFSNIESYDEIKEIMELRYKVFTGEKKFDPRYDFDEFDFTATHIAMILDGKTIGTTRIYKDNNRGNLGRLCVLAEYRNFKLSIPLLLKSYQVAVEMGFTEFDMLAQYQLVPYYEKCGAIKTGEQFILEDYPYVPMTIVFADIQKFTYE